MVPTGGAGIREGCDVTLRCQSESHPPARNYSWIRKVPGHPPQVIAVSETLTLPSVSRREKAVFFCRVSNDLGTDESAPFHLNVEYGPEISWESKCAERAEGITCVCAANSNPPAVITWHLPHANLSGNQTHGGFVSEQVREGHLVKGFLILTGHQDEEEVVVSCSVQNPHGTSSFKVYLWVKEERHLVNLVLAVIVGALAMLVMLLLLCLISLFCQRRTKVHVIDGTEMEDLTVPPQPVRPTSREVEDEVEDEVEETEEEAECRCEGGSEVSAGRQTENGEHLPVSDRVELHYACIDFTKSQPSHGIVGNRDSTQYAEIKLQ
ncbi:sialic acid-binding Ig-like lectin 5 [Hemiscyllium ocellatum]|uniref:sialic acid-binding Ig-like lectin 5 n=1 Tax=Hemiscyllium ocellatum TaxID=170820 RepID=UPI0029676E47|nr:sialic acid-binding Ig-like lectin 5 [Hemiscyllium ocellatum]